MSTPASDPQTDAIRIRGLAKRYGAYAVLAGVDIHVKPGELFGLVGVNGAGKTTLIKALLDFCDVDAGEISIFGTRHTLPDARQRLAFLPERFNPPYYQTGRDFLRFVARMHRLEYDAPRVTALCEALDLDPGAIAKPVKDYSKGMAQKLGLAGCLLADRDLMLLDEPMSGLDPKARMLFKQQLVALQARGRTVFFSTHLLADVEELCDRMAILHDGDLRFVGTPRACCETYDTFNLEQAFLNCIGERRGRA
jgi:ABC-2 type transport system ATP-binding protein